MKEKKANKKLTNLQIIKKILKPRTIFVLIFLLVANSLAWFVYATKVDTSMEVYVRAWKVIFAAGDSEIVDFLDIKVDSMYPGMEEFDYELTAYNKSDISANISYQILEINILGDLLITKEGREHRGEAPVSSDLSSAEMAIKLANDYPFTIEFDLTDSNMDAETGISTYKTIVKWPFESGDDELDTEWGIAAFEYRDQNPTSACITLKVKVIIVQSTD